MRLLTNGVIFRFIIFIFFSLSEKSLFANDCNVRGIKAYAPVLCGSAMQGGMIYAESDWIISEVNGSAQSKNGIFAMPISMEDERKIITLRFCKDDKCQNFDYKISRRDYKKQTVSVDEKFMIYPEEVQRRIDKENDAIIDVRGNIDYSFAEFMDFRYPFSKKYKISGTYGSRRVFNGEDKRPHQGFDIAAPEGTKVRPIGRGRVILVIEGYLVGKTVFIDHGYGIFSAYLHLSKINVKKGDIVNFDSVIGSVGSTGRVSGPHLHLGLYFNQTAIDPELAISY